MGKFKHIVITGASSGIGRALAEEYARAYKKGNLTLSITGRNQKRLSEVAEFCRAQNIKIHDAVLDVTDRSAMNDWLMQRDQETPIDLIIANAGISGGTGDQGLEGPDQVRALLDINVYGVLNTIDPLIPRMIARGNGHIAIISSLAGFRGWPGAPAYCASKATVKVYGEGLRGSLADKGINVSVVCPGFVKSPMTDQNDYPMPFLVPAQKASQIIIKGLEKNKGRIAFPLPMYFFAWLLGTLPDKWSHAILKKAPGKKPLS